MTTHPKFPRGYQIPPGTTVLSVHLSDKKMAVKVNLFLDGEQQYLVCSPLGESTGELLTLDEVGERIRLGTA